MRVDAKGLKDSKKLKFKARSVTEECKELTLAATCSEDTVLLARLFRYLLNETEAGVSSFSKAVDDLLEAKGFEG